MDIILKRRIDAGSGSVFVTLKPSAVRPEAVLTAAHVLSRKADVWLEEGEAELRPKAGKPSADALEALAAEFAEEAVTQELRRRVAESNRSVRDYLVTQALVSAAGAQGTAQPTMGNLSEDQEKDIDQLIAEAERELAAGQPATAKGGTDSDVRKP
ncbi:MAG: hypothetical protein FD126_1760 [Elusimicrobia bacterium]|nr:MAG: hypothetical protein FD126_1760 [Elusimicrobiota bacterium]